MSCLRCPVVWASALLAVLTLGIGLWHFGLGAPSDQPKPAASADPSLTPSPQPRAPGDRLTTNETTTLPVIAQLPSFALTERDGSTVTLADLKGHVWIANLMFTRCAGVCPVMSRRLSELQRALRDVPELRLVSVSVDPQHDTPEVLTSYAASYEADPQRWLFLTGKKPNIIDLALDGFKLSAGDDPNLHSPHLVLVDQWGRHRGYYDSRCDKSLRQLRHDVRKLLKEPPQTATTEAK